MSSKNLCMSIPLDNHILPTTVHMVKSVQRTLVTTLRAWINHRRRLWEGSIRYRGNLLKIREREDIVARS